MLHVLGRPNSINVRKVLWLCAELELTHQHEPWGVADMPLRSADFLALNPNALVPVIRDGDFVLWESNSICRYLANQQPRGTLLPHEPRARAQVEQWMDWQATELNTAWRYSIAFSAGVAVCAHAVAAAPIDNVAPSARTHFN